MALTYEMKFTLMNWIPLARITVGGINDFLCRRYRCRQYHGAYRSTNRSSIRPFLSGAKYQIFLWPECKKLMEKVSPSSLCKANGENAMHGIYM